MNSHRSTATSTLSVFAALCLSAAFGHAAPLSEATAVLTRPDPSAPVLTLLKAGSEPPASAQVAPDGWTAVEVPGPFEGYVQNAELTKGLDVKPGSSIYLAPKPDAGVLATAAKGDKISITGLYGKWTQVRLEKAVIGYIHTGALPAVGQSAETPQTSAMPAPPAAAPAPSTEAGRPAMDGSGSELPRFFQGQFVSSRRLFSPRRPYDWQLNDSAGSRIAYLDISKLLQTDQIDRYVGHTVAVFGSVKPMPGGRDIVIAVESLQLK